MQNRQQYKVESRHRNQEEEKEKIDDRKRTANRTYLVERKVDGKGNIG